MAGRVVKGVAWSAMERFSVQIVQFVVSLVLARLLTPEIYGSVALSLVILNILQTINETGFGAALMQKLDRDELDFSSVFVLNMALGVGLYAVLFLCAPFLSNVLGYPELTSIIRWIGLNLIIMSFVVVQRTKLIINVDFKTMAKASLLGAFLSGGIAIICAYRGMGAMALVIQSLLNNLITTLFIWIQAKWHPKLVFSWERFKSLFDFAYKLILSRFVQSVYNEVYSLVVGAFYTPTQLGLYNRAKSFETLSTNNITMIVQRVAQPLLCEQQQDKRQMAVVLTKFISNTALVVYPLLVGLMVLAKPLVLVLLTDKWDGCVWILQVVCLVGFFFVGSTFNRNVFNATGRTDWALQSETIRKVIAVTVIIGAVYCGFTVLVWSQVLIACIEFVIDAYYTQKQIQLTIWEQIKAVLPILVVASIMGGVVFVVSIMFEMNLLKLLVGGLSGVICYMVLCYTFNICDFRNRIKLVIR